MKKVSLSLFVAGLLFNFFGASLASAEDRVIEEELVLKDPTVANAKNFVVGGSLEEWYVTGPYNTYDQNGKLASYGTINGGMPGGNIFAGWGDFTLQYSHREGKFAIDSAYTTGAVGTNTEKQFETEVTGRYLFKVSPHFNPYVIAGYNGTSLTENNVLKTGNWNYGGVNHGKVSASETKYSSGLIGVGAIVPFNKYVGMRADGRLLFTHGQFVRDDGLTTTGSGVGGGGTLTAYFNIVQGLNLQTGVKGQVLYAGPNLSAFGRFGLFGSLGYSYKF